MLLLLASSLWSCEDKWEDTIPNAGENRKGFTRDILKGRGDCEIFLEAVEKAGYQSLVEGKGLSTMFVPTDVAFRRFFRRNGYNSLDDIPEATLKSMVGQHILRYSYSQDQLLNFQPQLEVQEHPAGIYFRHWTVYQDGVEIRHNPVTNTDIKVYNVDKFLPVFNTNLFKSLGLKEAEQNYKYFFPRSNWYGEGDHIYPANAGVMEDPIPSDNGYVYIVDNVIEPLRTIYRVLEDESKPYGIMRELYDRFPGYRLMGTRYDQSYADATGDNYWFFHYNTSTHMLLAIGCEWTTDRDDWILLPKVTYNGFVPSDNAMNAYFREYWGDPSLTQKYDTWEDLDNLAVYHLIRNHFMDMDGMVFPEHLRKGLVSEWGTPYKFDVDSDVDYKEVCGNGVVYGLNKVEPPAVFEGITRPLFQTPKYKMLSYITDLSGMLPLLVDDEEPLTMFIPSDDIFTGLGYNLYYGGSAFQLANISVRTGTSSSTALSVNQMELLVRNQLVEGLISPEDIHSETPVWHETLREDSFLKIGNGMLETEDGTKIYLGTDQFNTNSRYGNWRAYEVRGIASGTSLKNFASAVSTTTSPYYSMLNNNYRLKIINNSGYFNGSGDLIPFRYSRGLMFVTLDAWASPGTNGIPEVNVNDTEAMTAWLNKHAIGRKTEENFRIIDFLTGDAVGKEYTTLDEEFKIRIVAMEEVSEIYGTYKLTIQLPASEGNRRVEAYGPHFAKETMFYIITRASDRFVWEE